MKNKFWALIFIFVCLASTAWSAIRLTQLGEGKRVMRATDRDSGKILWNSVVNAQKIKDSKGNLYLYIEENGLGIYGPDKKFKTWRSTAYFILDGDKVIPYQVRQIYKDKSGKVVKDLQKYYYLQNKQVVCKINGETKTFEFYDDLVDKELVGPVLAAYSFEDKKDLNFHLLTHEPSMYKVSVKFRGVEGGNYKLEMVPDLGALNLLGGVIPKMYFWCEVKPPHKFVKYEGLEGGMNTANIRLEKISN